MKNKALSLILTIFVNLSAFGACPTIIMSGQQVSCYNGSNGQATVTILAGASGNYTYTWSNGVITSGPTGSTISSLSAGTYTVSVRDNVTGCTVTGAYVVGQPDQLIISGNATNVLCRGNSTGSINISVNGGIGPYSYSWENSSGVQVATTQNLSNVIAGVYTVTVNAPNSTCSASATFTISEPSESLQASSIIQNVACFTGSTGSINLSVWGGTPSYSYNWSNGASTQNIQNLATGSYNVVITDANGCTFNDTYFISEPTQLSATISSTPVDCFGNSTGSISTSVTGGTTPYSYQWSNSSTLFAINSAALTNIPADNYSVTITDANGCQFTISSVVTQPSELLLSTSSTNVSCFGGANGTVNSIVSGGVSPYNYLWTNSLNTVVGTTSSLIGLPAETYTLVVNDQNGCSKTSTEIITQPEAPISVNFTKQDVLCFGDATGSIQLQVDGGTPTYTYSWSNGEITNGINNLISGTYTYLVTDNNNCTESGSITIEQPSAPLQVLPTIQDVSCFGLSNGSISLSVNGGTPGYTYSWQNSQFLLSIATPSLINFPAEQYRYEVTDANGCKSIDTLTINQPTLLTSTISGVNINCKGENTGSTEVNVSGGVTPYSYSWNTGGVVPTLNNLFAGFYEVTIVDANNCVTTNSITLTEPEDSLSYSFTTIDVLCNDGNNGQINLLINGGTSPYFYDWSNGDTQPVIQGLTAGMYSFVVTDINGCSVADSAEIFQPDPLEMNETITNASCFEFSDGIIDIDPTGGTGPYTYTWFNSMFALSSTQQDLINYPADIYQVIIQDTNNCIYESFFEITHPEALVVDYTFTPISCFDGFDGNIIVTVEGGTEDYTFDWSNGAITQNQLNVPIGIYTLVVTDDLGCQETITATLDEPEPITMSFTTVEVTCVDQFDGIAEVFPTGGNGGYTFNWNNGETQSINTGLAHQWYFITVTDILGCIGQDSVFIGRNNIGCIEPVNAFSPNGDNYNDTWIIDNLELYPTMQMQIFNKWGNLIHSQEGLYSPWDGTHNDRPLPADVYYYILNLNNEDNDILTGNITIIR